MKKYIILQLLLLVFFIQNETVAKIHLPAVLSDNMVLQGGTEVNIWGWTTKTAEWISVWGSWGSDTVKVQADLGRWRLKLKTPSDAKGVYEVHIKGHEHVIIENVLIGEVWICSGQSNMEMGLDSISKGLAGVLNFKEKIQEADNPSIRLFQVSKRVSEYPQDDCTGQWVECSPETVKNFSAVGYFFGKEINEKLNRPVGLINSSWGGTNAETWMPKEIIEGNKVYLKGLSSPSRRSRPSQPGQAYNAMIYPLINFNITGALWYQGENNRFNPEHYDGLLTDLIKRWREDWQSDFPFYYVQIAPYNYKDKPAVQVREAQLKVLSVPKTGMVVTNDIGNLSNIHPRDKEEVGRRLALWALSETYDFSDIVCSGPLYRSMTVENREIIIDFDYADGGLIKKGKHLTCFEIAGEDRKFVEAKAEIKGNSVVVSSREVKNPVAVRFAFSDTAEPNLFNSAHLPASAFRSDNWQIETGKQE